MCFPSIHLGSLSAKVSNRKGGGGFCLFPKSQLAFKPVITTGNLTSGGPGHDRNCSHFLLTMPHGSWKGP